MNRYCRSSYVLCALFLFAGGGFLSTALEAQAKHPGDTVSFYIEAYGEILPASDAEVAKAHQVFERVRAVADKNSKRLPRLVVVDSAADPWAVALPDGHIVLSRRAVSICHRQASEEEIEARLAFVLGHELAHLAHDDFWHREVYAFVTKKTDTDNIAQVLRKNRAKSIEQELAADDAGFIYAALAGFPVDRLIRTKEVESHFFEYWMRQTQTRTNDKHPTIKKRAELMRQRLGDLQDKIVLFEYGVRLSHFDNCYDAVYFLREFQKTFPGREVLNNIGYCYLQMARQEMEPQRAFFYWMPLLLDCETRAHFKEELFYSPNLRIAPGGTRYPMATLRQSPSGAEQGFLREAVDYLQRAVNADPSYLPAKKNLVVAFLYLGRPHSARAVLADAQRGSLDDPTVDVLDALALYEQTEAGLDLWSPAIAKLEKLVTGSSAPRSALFNLARLLTVRSRTAEAQAYWHRLADDAELLPAPIRTIVCRQQSSMQQQSCSEYIPFNDSPPGEWPVSKGNTAWLSKKIREEHVGGWKIIGFDWFKDNLHGHIYQRPDGSAEVLELDNFVQMQVLKGESLGTAKSLKKYCRNPLQERQLVQGKLLSCGYWAALVKGGDVKEIWSVLN